ncbi:MarR family winged helix-turn-helix transcriptional regulator [Olsenella sp. Marseille-P4559]|uniref:MarR family winged helix-turn-helix transcriptional regulator n=1 Tax=Olsenella sp. Marseille-P4559 TaxID=2364795 RepID=UPI0013EF45A4|nr:winged helix DNA-binding protein [Olsenella sp. Marseille-P4559]
MPDEQFGIAEAEGVPVPTVRDMDIACQEVNRLYYEISKGCGVSETACWILFDVLVAGGSCPQSTFASMHSLSRQTVSSTMKSLVARGLVSLDYGEEDRRSKVVSLTAKGRAFCARRIEPALRAEQRAFETLSKGERTQFVGLVRRYAAAVSAEVRALRDVTSDEANRTKASDVSRL